MKNTDKFIRAAHMTEIYMNHQVTANQIMSYAVKYNNDTCVTPDKEMVAKAYFVTRTIAKNNGISSEEFHRIMDLRLCH